MRVAALAACLLGCASALAPAALWGHAWGGTAGRAGVSGVSGPRCAPPAAPGSNHLLRVSWRWALPSGASSSFYYGGIDAAGDVYYLATGNGAASHVVYKVSGTSGSLLWASTPIPAPRYANYYGSDHLVVWSDAAVYVIAGTTYTLPDCAWIARLDATSGQREWWLNGTATVVSAVLSSDGAHLYAAFANGSVASIDATTGSVAELWDLSSFLPSPPSIAFTMSLAAGAPNERAGLRARAACAASDVLVFGCAGNFTGVTVAGGHVLWHIADPVGGDAYTSPRSPASGAFADTVFTSLGANYQQGAGAAAFSATTGRVRWTQPTQDIIASVGALATQGWEWQVSMPGSGSYSLISVVSMADGTPLASKSYYTSFGFSSNPSVSADGACLYIFGSGDINTQSACTLLSFCFNGSVITPEFVAPVSGVHAPSRYQAAPGPLAGQFSIWHDAGVMRVEQYTPLPAPPAPSPPPAPPAPRSGTGELAVLVFSKDASTCLSGAGNVSLTPASLVRTRGSPAWVLGKTSMQYGLSGSCSVVRAPAAVDTAGRRAWVMFSCAPAGGSYTSYVAELALGQPGDAPALAGVCTARSLNAITPLFYSAAVNKSAPWYVGPLAPFSRAFYTLAVPTGLSTNVGITPPLCTLTNIGELRAAPLVPTQSMYVVDDVPPADGSSGGAAAAMLYAVSSSDFGIRLIGISVPGGISTLDITLPCDTGVCVGSAVSFAGVRGGAVTVGGNAPYFADWSSATLAQSLQLTSAGTNATPPTTFIGRLSRAAPSSFPLVLPATVALLPNPGSTEADADITWLQSLSWGSVACTSASSRAQLRSIAMLSSAAPDFVLVTNTSVPACPLSDGQQCYALGIAYVEAFAAVAA